MKPEMAYRFLRIVGEQAKAAVEALEKEERIISEKADYTPVEREDAWIKALNKVRLEFGVTVF
ncbi:MAG: hypothetical protein Q4B48_06015 [Syntrophomonadaceae bacterium]|nr:hypothetical protein [Syntrophomonadaceae bacterium]